METQTPDEVVLAEINAAIESLPTPDRIRVNASGDGSGYGYGSG